MNLKNMIILAMAAPTKKEEAFSEEAGERKNPSSHSPSSSVGASEQTVSKSTSGQKACKSAFEIGPASVIIVSEVSAQDVAQLKIVPVQHPTGFSLSQNEDTSAVFMTVNKSAIQYVFV